MRSSGFSWLVAIRPPGWLRGSTRRPVRLAFDCVPKPDALARRLESQIPPNQYHDDVHGRPDWRRHMTFEFAAEILSELGGERP